MQVAGNYRGRFFRPRGSLKYSFEFRVLVIWICFEFLPAIASATAGRISDLFVFSLSLTQVVLELTNVVHKKAKK